MAGPIEIDENTIKPKEHIATPVFKKDADGNIARDSSGRTIIKAWRAGPDAKGYTKGQFVSKEYAQRARAVRQHNNAVKANMRKLNLTESEARERVKEEKAKRDVLVKERDQLVKDGAPDEEIQEIMDQIRDINQSIGGSP